LLGSRLSETKNGRGPTTPAVFIVWDEKFPFRSLDKEAFNLSGEFVE
jgi:hypothetical protein